MSKLAKLKWNELCQGQTVLGMQDSGDEDFSDGLITYWEEEGCISPDELVAKYYNKEVEIVAVIRMDRPDLESEFDSIVFKDADNVYILISDVGYTYPGVQVHTYDVLEELKERLQN